MPSRMAYHKGNAKLVDVTADNLRTPWVAWTVAVDDPYAAIVPDALAHGKYFNTRNLVIVSLYLRVGFGALTPSPYSTLAVLLPEGLRVKAGTAFRAQAMAERTTTTAERKFSACNFYVDGETRGGTDGQTYLYLDRIFVENLGQFVANQTYVLRGQLTFEPSAA